MKSIKPIILVMPNCIDAPTLRRLKHAGYLVVETTDLAGVKIITPPPLVPLDKLAGIAIGVLADEGLAAYSLREAFQKRLLKAALEQMGETLPTKPSNPKPPAAEDQRPPTPKPNPSAV